VTHLAQVAAFANHHLKVLKSADGEFTNSSVVNLTEFDRVTELARMLSGLADSEAAKSNALELLQIARAEQNRA
jgi:DNA repair protein RecN (Recombination protein N)